MLYNKDGNEILHIQRNNETKLFIKQNTYTALIVSLNDKVTFYVNNEKIEEIEISKNILERRSLSIVLNNSKILDEIVIDKNNLTTSFGLGSGISYTKQERAVRFDNQVLYRDPLTGKYHFMIDGLINKLSGRAKINKKALGLDIEITKIQRFLNVYSDEYLYLNYDLPKDQALYFAIAMVPYIEKYTDLLSLDFQSLIDQQMKVFKKN